VAVQFEDYVQARGQSLVRFAYVLCNDAHTAEDLAQSALAKAYRHWRRVSASDHPDAYVQRIIVNTYLSARRRRWTNELPVSDPTRPGDDAASDIADVSVARDAFVHLLEGLAPRAKAVLVLRYYADLDDAVIAVHLGISRGSVRSTASRALAQLRQAQAASVGEPDTTGRRRSS
jgi:RNA polymerase sigma-70 factor (sigma-E family)